MLIIRDFIKRRRSSTQRLLNFILHGMVAVPLCSQTANWPLNQLPVVAKSIPCINSLSKYISKGAIEMKFSPYVSNNPSNSHMQIIGGLIKVLWNNEKRHREEREVQ